jgi:elongation factor P
MLDTAKWREASFRYRATYRPCEAKPRLRYLDFMVAASQLRTGMCIRFSGIACHVKWAGRKSGGVVRPELGNLRTGRITSVKFREELEFEEVPAERETMSYLFADADQYWFMNTRTFDQIALSKSLLRERTAFLKEGMIVTVKFVDGVPIAVLYFMTVETRVAFMLPMTHYQSKYKWQRVQLENGVEVTAPLFVKAGDSVRVDLDLLTVFE